MEGIGKITGVLVLLWAVGAAIVSFFVWWFLIPRQVTKTYREELKYRQEQEEKKDKELFKLRGEVDEAAKRLARAEEKLDHMEERVGNLAAWKYGAERYMNKSDEMLLAQGIQTPDRARYGINGDD